MSLSVRELYCEKEGRMTLHELVRWGKSGAMKHQPIYKCTLCGKERDLN